MQETSSSPVIETSKKRGEKAATLRKLTKKQKIFATEYLDTGNGTQSALKAYDTSNPKVAGVIAVENLAKPNVQAFLESKSERAAQRVVELSEQDEERGVALSASKDILDRTGHKAPEKHLHVSLAVSKEEREKMLGITTQVIEKMTHEEITG